MWPVGERIVIDLKSLSWNFPGSLVVMSPCFPYRGCRFDPWLGN